ncbi:type II secretion system protein GspM [Gammaproteobacteria bacterium]|nr:type II secretion system protein GspM [Gammaproteobacteria bacterium]
MNKLRFYITEKFNLLQAREKRLLYFGLALSLLCLAFISVNPLLSKHTKLSQELELLKSDFIWISSKVSVVKKLENACSSRNYKRGTTEDQIKNLARRNLLSVNSFEQTEDKIKFQLSGSDANQFLDFYSQASCSGYKVDQVIMTTSLENTYDATIVAAPVEY